MAALGQREDVKRLRIPVEESIVTFASGYEIGPRLRVCKNLVHNYIRSSSAAVFPFGEPVLPGLSTAVTLVKAPIDPIGPVTNPSLMGGWLSSIGNSSYWVVADVAGGLRRIFNVETGARLAFIGSVWGVDSGLPSFAFAPNISVPTLFVVIPNEAKKKIIETSPGSGTFQAVDYSPVFDPGPVDQIYYHLNRLFQAQHLDGRRSLIFFTDPINTDIIRGNNFLDVPDHTTVMFRASPSDVDLGSQAHLIIGCKSSIHILDGDPTLGNAVFRQLKKTFGIATSRQVAETSEGACFIGTDSLIYLMPRGGTEPIPISGFIRDKFLYTNTNLILGWQFPYLYVFEGSQRIWLGDMGNSQQGIYWTGPHAVSQLFGIHGYFSDHPFELNKTFVSILDGGIAKTARFSGFSNNGQILETGYISEPDCDVVFKRAIFDMVQASVDRAFRLTVYNNQKQSSFRDFVVPAQSLLTSPDAVAKELVITVPQELARGDFFFMRLESNDPTTLGSLRNLRNWNIEYRVVPRKD